MRFIESHALHSDAADRAGLATMFRRRSSSACR
jgi:hypothetical protein